MSVDTPTVDRQEVIADVDHVLVISGRGRKTRTVCHLPHPERPTRPRCETGDRRLGANYMRRSPRTAHWPLCRRCDPEYDIDYGPDPENCTGNHDGGEFTPCVRDGCEFGAEVAIVRIDTGDRRHVCPPCGRRIVDTTPMVGFVGDRPEPRPKQSVDGIPGNQ